MTLSDRFPCVREINAGEPGGLPRQTIESDLERTFRAVNFWPAAADTEEMLRAIPVMGVLIALAVGGWLFAQQSKTEGPTAPAVTQAESQALAATVATNFSQVVPALDSRYAQTGSYVGAELPSESGVTLVSASSTSYCLESNAGGQVVHENGPGGSPADGPC